MNDKFEICPNYHCIKGMVINEKGEMDYCKTCNCTGYKPEDNKLTNI